MTSKKTPTNRLRDLNSQKIRRILIVQNLQIRSLQRENDRLKQKICIMESAHTGPYKFFYKLAYACEVILNLVSKPFRRRKK